MLTQSTDGHLSAQDSYDVHLEIIDDDEGASWDSSIDGKTSGPSSDRVLAAVSQHQFALFNSSEMLDYELMNASSLKERSNKTLLFVVPGPASFYSPVVDVTLAMDGDAFEGNLSGTRQVRLTTTWQVHVEEIETGVVEHSNYEASLLGAAPNYLGTAAWTPNLLAQVENDPSAPLMHTLEISLIGDSWIPSLGEPDDGTGPTSQLLAALTSSQDEPQGWNSQVLGALDASHVRRASSTLLVVTLPFTSSYSIAKPCVAWWLDPSTPRPLWPMGFAHSFRLP